jgi:hypothetical protein
LYSNYISPLVASGADNHGVVTEVWVAAYGEEVSDERARISPDHRALDRGGNLLLGKTSEGFGHAIVISPEAKSCNRLTSGLAVRQGITAFLIGQPVHNRKYRTVLISGNTQNDLGFVTAIPTDPIPPAMANST